MGQEEQDYEASAVERVPSGLGTHRRRADRRDDERIQHGDDIRIVFEKGIADAIERKLKSTPFVDGA